MIGESFVLTVTHIVVFGVVLCCGVVVVVFHCSIPFICYCFELYSVQLLEHLRVLVFPSLYCLGAYLLQFRSHTSPKN